MQEEKLCRKGRPNTPDPDQSSFRGQLGLALRICRERQCLTLDDASRLTDFSVSKAKISYYENGQHEPKLGDWLSLCAAYGVRISDMLPREVYNYLIVCTSKKIKRRPKDVRRVFKAGRPSK